MRSPTIARTVQVLDFLTVHHARGFTPAELSRRLRISKSTAPRPARHARRARAPRAPIPRTNLTTGSVPALIPMGAVAEAALRARSAHARTRSQRCLAEDYDGECRRSSCGRGEEVLPPSATPASRHAAARPSRAGQRRAARPAARHSAPRRGADEAVDAWLGRLGPELSDIHRCPLPRSISSTPCASRGFAVVLLHHQRLRRPHAPSLAHADLCTPEGREQDPPLPSPSLAHDDYIPPADRMPLDAEVASIAAPIFNPDGTMRFAISLAPRLRLPRPRPCRPSRAPYSHAAGRVTTKIGGHPPPADRPPQAATRN